MATLQPPGQCPLPSSPHAASYGGPHVSTGPDGARGVSEGPSCKGKRHREPASFVSTSFKIKKKPSIFLESPQLGDSNVFIQSLSLCLPRFPLIIPRL